MEQILRASMRSLLAVTTLVVSAIWEDTRSSGRLPSSRLPTYGTATCTMGIRESTVAPTIRHTGTPVVVSRTDASYNKQDNLANCQKKTYEIKSDRRFGGK